MRERRENSYRRRKERAEQSWERGERLYEVRGGEQGIQGQRGRRKI